MSNEIIKVIDELVKRFGIIIDWTSENVMPYLLDLYERCIAYHITLDVLYLVLWVGLIVVYVFFIKTMIKLHKKATETGKSNWLFDVKHYMTFDDEVKSKFICDLLTSVLTMLSLISSAIALDVIGELFELIFIPEVYMMDWIKIKIS